MKIILFAMAVYLLTACQTQTSPFNADEALQYCDNQVGRTLDFLCQSDGSEIDASIIYADYYYIEALLRLKMKAHAISAPEGMLTTT